MGWIIFITFYVVIVLVLFSLIFAKPFLVDIGKKIVLYANLMDALLLWVPNEWTAEQTLNRLKIGRDFAIIAIILWPITVIEIVFVLGLDFLRNR